MHSVRFEIKSIGPREFEGYGSVFGNKGLGDDIVLPGAFRSTLEEHKAAGTMPLMYWMHQSDQVPGVWLDMQEDKAGLYVKGELVDTALGRDVRTLLSKKAVRGLSMGYRPTSVGWDNEGNRLLKTVDLFEVSIVSMAMNPLARVEAMKARLSGEGEYVPTEREIEQHFRTMGCSKGVARQLIARLFEGEGAGGMPASPRWDAGDADEEKQLVQALASLTDRIGAQALRRF